MINLRNYQQSAVDAIRRAYANKKRAPLLVVPTGGGKTTIFAYVTQQASFKPKKDKKVKDTKKQRQKSQQSQTTGIRRTEESRQENKKDQPPHTTSL